MTSQFSPYICLCLRLRRRIIVRSLLVFLITWSSHRRRNQARPNVDTRNPQNCKSKSIVLGLWSDGLEFLICEVYYCVGAQPHTVTCTLLLFYTTGTTRIRGWSSRGKAARNWTNYWLISRVDPKWTVLKIDLW